MITLVFYTHFDMKVVPFLLVYVYKIKTVPIYTLCRTDEINGFDFLGKEETQASYKSIYWTKVVEPSQAKDLFEESFKWVCCPIKDAHVIIS
jgi:hypothetical protein